MADPIWQTRIKKLLDLDKTRSRFLGSLNTELRWKLINSKCWMQYGESNVKNGLIPMELTQTTLDSSILFRVSNADRKFINFLFRHYNQFSELMSKF